MFCTRSRMGKYKKFNRLLGKTNRLQLIKIPDCAVLKGKWLALKYL